MRQIFYCNNCKAAVIFFFFFCECLRPYLSCSGGSLDLVKTNSDIEVFRKATGASSVMLARAAMWNASVFSEGGPFPLERVMEDYLKYVSLSGAQTMISGFT